MILSGALTAGRNPRNCAVGAQRRRGLEVPRRVGRYSAATPKLTWIHARDRSVVCRPSAANRDYDASFRAKTIIAHGFSERGVCRLLQSPALLRNDESRRGRVSELTYIHG